MKKFVTISLVFVIVAVSFRTQWAEAQDRKEPIYHQFEEYDGTMNARAMTERLDGLAEYLKANPNSRAYLVSYGGRRSCHGEAKNRSAPAKSYLIKKKGIYSGRISILDAGYRTAWAVELWVGNASPHDPPPPRMRALNRVEVSINKKCNSPLLRFSDLDGPPPK